MERSPERLKAWQEVKALRLDEDTKAMCVSAAELRRCRPEMVPEDCWEHARRYHQKRAPGPAYG